MCACFREEEVLVQSDVEVYVLVVDIMPYFLWLFINLQNYVIAQKDIQIKSSGTGLVFH